MELKEEKEDCDGGGRGSGSWNMLLKINFHMRTIRLLRSGMTDLGCCVCVCVCQILLLDYVPKGYICRYLENNLHSRHQNPILSLKQSIDILSKINDPSCAFQLFLLSHPLSLKKQEERRSETSCPFLRRKRGMWPCSARNPKVLADS